MGVAVLSEAQETSPGPEGARRPGTNLVLTVAAAGIVLVLALGAVLWPAGRSPSLRGLVLVFDSAGDSSRVDGLYRPLASYLEQVSGHAMDLEVAPDSAAFFAAASRGADFIFCPDGLALGLDPESYEPLVTARRAAPRNLRPRGVLVYRLSAGLVERPWFTEPGRTVVGDSVSLAGAGAVLGNPLGTGLSWGPDPYDHGPVLHAARLGAFDYACVRQWDAERFFDANLLPREEWGLEFLTDPVPDLVLMASRRIPANIKLAVGENLAGFARTDEPITPAGETLGRGLPLLRLVGFNLLLEPDFDRVRGIFTGHWHPESD
jgi:hypothetical protein